MSVGVMGYEMGDCDYQHYVHGARVFCAWRVDRSRALMCVQVCVAMAKLVASVCNSHSHSVTPTHPPALALLHTLYCVTVNLLSENR